MYDCKKCGVNNWKFQCQQGLMKGYCQGCGAETNTFKAKSGERYTKKTLDEVKKIKGEI